MSCYRPLPAYRDKSGAVKIGRTAVALDCESFELPCGRCVGCKLDRARQWSVRIMNEAQLYDVNWFCTLTYRDEDVSWSLDYRDFQLFMKRVRRAVKGADGRNPVRFFCAGEYGSKRRRPHFHCILFNLRFGDEVALVNESFRSVEAERLWKKGHVDLRMLTQERAAYVARYTLGKAQKESYEDVVDLDTGEVLIRHREMLHMSNRPGIGSAWYAQYAGDCFPHDFAVSCGDKRTKVPRYYWNKFRLEADGALVEEVEHARFLRARERKEESTPERRAVREELAERKLDRYGPREDL